MAPSLPQSCQPLNLAEYRAPPCKPLRTTVKVANRSSHRQVAVGEDHVFLENNAGKLRGMVHSGPAQVLRKADSPFARVEKRERRSLMKNDDAAAT